VGTAIPGCYASPALRAISKNRPGSLATQAWKKPVRPEDIERAIGEMDLGALSAILQRKNAPSAMRDIRAASFSLITLPIIRDWLGL
jgi:hypothetical protein